MATAAPLDQVLVQRFQQGDNTAFEDLMRKYQSKVFQLIKRYIKNPDESLDVSQDAFIKAYLALPNFRGESAFYTWMYRIAINTAKNELARRRWHSAAEEIEVEEAESLDLADRLKEHDTPEGLAMSDELVQAIQRGFDQLPEELRIALTLREFHDYSYDKIAEIMTCPVGTVRSRIFRARSALDKELAYVYD